MKGLPLDFNWKEYLILNKDLNQAFTYEQTVMHYLQYGANEKRKYKLELKKKILIVILSCKKNYHLWESIKNRTNENMIILCGLNKENNENERDKHVTKYNKKRKILYLNCDDGYDSLPEKIILTIDYILNNNVFKNITHIIKIDDHDNFFKNEDIINLYKLPELNDQNYIGQKKNTNGEKILSKWHFGKVSEKSFWYNRPSNVSNVTYLDGGCTYILSRKAMKIINDCYNSSNIKKLRQTEIYEDIMIGKIMQDHSIKPCVLNYNIQGDK